MIYYFLFNIVGILVPSFFVRTLWRNWHLPVSLPLTLFISLVVAICILSIFGMTVYATEILLHHNITLVIGFMTTTLWFWVTYEFIKKRKLDTKYIVLIFIEPVLMIIISLTNHMHGLFSIDGANIANNIIANEQSEMKIFRKLHMLYSLGLISISLFWLGHYLIKYSKRSVIEMIFLIAVLCLPTASFLLYVFGYLPVRIGAPLSIVLVLLGMYRFKMVDIVPIGRDQIIDQIDEGLILINNDGFVVDANAAAIKLLNLETNNKSKITQPIPYPQKIKSLFDSSSNKSQVFELKGQVDSGDSPDLELQQSPIIDINNLKVGKAVFVRDISERKKAEYDREFYIQEIEQSRQKLEKLDQYKSAFFANISHEFKTPLTLSLGPLEDISNGLHGEITGETKSQINRIIQHNQRLLELINQILEISRLENIKKIQSIEVINWDEYLPNVISGFKDIADSAGISIFYKSDGRTAPVNMLRNHVDMIISNLLSNAVKNCKNNDNITVVVKSNDNSVSLSINDSGCGISTELLPHIFDRFYSDKIHHKNWPAGTGIGLSLVKQLVTNYGGNISVNSIEGDGSQFKILIPKSKKSVLKKIDKSIETDVIGSDTEDGIASELKNKPLILIVEDNVEMQQYIHQHLSKSFRVIKTENGSKGYKLAQKNMPDLIVSDVMMPVMDGIEMCESLKTNINTSHIPIILLTAKTEEKDKLIGLNAHADDYLNKPFSPNELIVRAKNLIQQRINLRDHYSHHYLKNHFPSGGENKVQSVDEIFMIKLYKIIKKNISNPDLQISQLASSLCISERQLQRKMKSLTGKTPKQLMLEIRLDYATKLLNDSELNISQIVDKIGFNSSSYFSKKFKQAYKKSPVEYKKSQ